MDAEGDRVERGMGHWWVQSLSWNKDVMSCKGTTNDPDVNDTVSHASNNALSGITDTLLGIEVVHNHDWTTLLQSKFCQRKARDVDGV